MSPNGQIGPANACDTDPLFEMFTPQARNAIVGAQDEARELGHRAVEVEHLLLGLFADRDGIAGRVLADFGLTVESVRELVRERLGVGSASRSDGSVRFSPQAKDSLRLANRIGLGEPATEHMLLAIVVRRENGACDILRALGADPNRIRFETKKRTWPSSFPEPGVSRTAELRLVRVVPAEDVGELDFGD